LPPAIPWSVCASWRSGLVQLSADMASVEDPDPEQILPIIMQGE